jgi:hypothetical protein
MTLVVRCLERYAIQNAIAGLAVGNPAGSHIAAIPGILGPLDIHVDIGVFAEKEVIQ